MTAHRVLWLSVCVPLWVIGAVVVVLAGSPVAVALCFVIAGLGGSLLAICVVTRYRNRGTRNQLRSDTAPAHLGAVAGAFAHATPESARLRAPLLCNLTDEQLCKRWRASYRASQRWSAAAKMIAIIVERQSYLDELERRNRSGFAAWLAAWPQCAEDPLPYLIGAHTDAPGVDWDELTRGSS